MPRTGFWESLIHMLKVSGYLTGGERHYEDTGIGQLRTGGNCGSGRG